MQVDWETLKVSVNDRSLSIQFVTLTNGYWLKAFDGSFELECTLSSNRQDEIDDFEANFKAAGNKSPQQQVITQFEKRDKTLKLACGSASVSAVDGTAVMLLKVPGTPGSSDGRWISSGTAFFDTVHPGDRVLGVYFTDEDNLLGAGAGTVVGSYTDDAADEANRGWFIPGNRGLIIAEAVGGYGFAPSGFYLKIIGKKSDSHFTGTLYVNLEWGQTG